MSLLLENKSKEAQVKATMEKLLKAAQGSEHPEEWFIFYYAAIDSGAEGDEPIALATQAIKDQINNEWTGNGEDLSPDPFSMTSEDIS